MICKLCSSNDVKTEYVGPIRLGMHIGYSKDDVKIFKCEKCGVYFNNYVHPEDHYESEEYRMEVEGTSDVNEYYRLHDGEVLNKLQWCGTTIFRNVIVADIGCAGGSFLDFVKGAASKTLAIEPSEIYRRELEKKGHIVYKYASEAESIWSEKVDIITSFDVIEHVSDPIDFMKSIYKLLKPGGRAIIGTPSEYPLLRKMVGKRFDSFIFHANHPWVFAGNSLNYIMEQAGFTNIYISQKCLFDMGNFIAWIKEEKPMGNVQFDFITDTINKTWQNEMINQGLGEYFVAYVTK